MPDRPDTSAAPPPLKQEALRPIFEHMEIGVYRMRPDGEGLEVNPALRRMLGAEGRLPPGPEEFRRRLEAEGRVSDVLRAWPGAGPDWVAESAWAIRDASGAIVAFAGTLVDATERVRAKTRAIHLARRDSMTGLSNRLDFTERLDAALAGPEPAPLALLLLDLDQFKAVNDTFGHTAGDALLKALSARMAELLAPEALLARYGGDEFVILLPGAGEAEALALADRLLAAAAAPLPAEGREVVVGTSLGVALAPRDGVRSCQLIQAADVALYQAKAAGRNTARVFTPAMAEAVGERRRFLAELRAALERGQFGLVYQPILAAGSGRVVGHEALLRWNRPGHGVVAADGFIGLAEDLGLLPAIGAWVLARACRDAAAAGGRDGSVWVNVSPLQLSAPGFEASLAAALEGAGLAPDRLVLEITETALMAEQAGLAAMIGRMRALGLRVALDDFGTGYSALGYLSRFDFDVIKIDRAFIQGLDQPVQSAIVGCVLDLARRLGIATVGEGVETEGQLAALRAAGCGLVQGHLFGPPLARLGG
jgi:diguanylate cyclase (GGDEF)-like protein